MEIVAPWRQSIKNEIVRVVSDMLLSFDSRRLL